MLLFYQTLFTHNMTRSVLKNVIITTLLGKKKRFYIERVLDFMAKKGKCLK